jgi:hypothetical protein
MCCLWCRRARGLGRLWVSHVDEYGRSKAWAEIASRSCWLALKHERALITPIENSATRAPSDKIPVSFQGVCQRDGRCEVVRWPLGHVAQPADDEAAEERLRSVSAVLASCRNRREVDFLFPVSCKMLLGRRTSSARYPPEGHCLQGGSALCRDYFRPTQRNAISEPRLPRAWDSWERDCTLMKPKRRENQTRLQQTAFIALCPPPHVALERHLDKAALSDAHTAATT